MKQKSKNELITKSIFFHDSWLFLFFFHFIYFKFTLNKKVSLNFCFSVFCLLILSQVYWGQGGRISTWNPQVMQIKLFCSSPMGVNTLVIYIIGKQCAQKERTKQMDRITCKGSWLLGILSYYWNIFYLVLLIWKTWSP